MSVVTTEVHDRVAVVTLNRPEARNALNRELLRALPEAMAAADADPDVDVIVLTGADPVFCAGLDLKELGASGAGVRAEDDDAGGFDGDSPVPGRPWARTVKPVIGAVNGAAVTGGLEIALHCDVLVASERARFADTHARVGVLPGWGMTVLLPQAVGVRRAKEMTLTGNFLAAEEAMAAGLVSRVVPHEQLLAEARRLAADIVSNDQAAVRALVASYDRVLAVAPEEGLRREGEAYRSWIEARFSAEEVARRRDAVVERGRSQA